MTILVVYVPSWRSPLRHTIKEGAAIVGADNSDAELVAGQVIVDFEGNLYGATNMRTFEERAYHAAERHVARYPTRARIAVKLEELVEVGLYDTKLKTVIVTNQTELDAWNK